MRFERKKAVMQVNGWGGWKMPIIHPNTSEYCEYGCPVCTRARKSIPWAVTVLKDDHALMTNGSRGRARRRTCGISPNQPISNLTH
jgi:hypothetical protein